MEWEVQCGWEALWVLSREEWVGVEGAAVVSLWLQIFSNTESQTAGWKELCFPWTLNSLVSGDIAPGTEESS